MICNGDELRVKKGVYIERQEILHVGKTAFIKKCKTTQWAEAASPLKVWDSEKNVTAKQSKSRPFLLKGWCLKGICKMWSSRRQHWWMTEKIGRVAPIDGVHTQAPEFLLKLSASTRLSEQQATVVNVSEECLDIRTALSVPLELKWLFVLRETTDEAQWGGFPGSSRLKHNSLHDSTEGTQGCVLLRLKCEDSGNSDEIISSYFAGDNTTWKIHNMYYGKYILHKDEIIPSTVQENI